MPLKLPRQRAREPGAPGCAGSCASTRAPRTSPSGCAPGDIAVIDHRDLDRVSAEALVACSPAAVVNAAPSISRPLPQPRARRSWSTPASRCSTTSARTSCATSHEGQLVRIDGDQLWRRRRRSSPRAGVRPRRSSQAAMDEARAGLAVQLEAFAANTMEYLRRERDLLLDGVGVPDIAHRDRRPARAHRRARLPLQGGPADAAALHPRVPPGAHRRRRRRRRAARGGLKPDLIVGDMDSVSDATLRCGAEIVVHAYRDGRAPGLERVAGSGVEPRRVPGDRDQRGRRDAARRRQGRRAHRRRRHPRHAGRVPRQGPRRAWPAPSSPGCGSAASSSTPRASAGSTARASPPRPAAHARSSA